MFDNAEIPGAYWRGAGLRREGLGALQVGKQQMTTIRWGTAGGHQVLPYAIPHQAMRRQGSPRCLE